MAQFEYITKTGEKKTVEAADSNTAMKSAADIAPTSGVAEIKNTEPVAEEKKKRTYSSKNQQEEDTEEDPLDQLYNEEAISKRRKEAEKLFADRRERLLDEVRSSSALRMKEIEQSGAERIASQGSINLRSGLGGSDFGARANADVRENTAMRTENEISRRKADITRVLNEIDTLVANQFEKEETRLKNSLEQQQASQKEKTEQALTSIKTLGKAGLDLDKIKTSDPDTYDKLKTLTGKGDIEIQAILDSERMDSGKINWNYKTVGSKVIAYGYDPISGQIKSLEQDLGINLDAKTGGSAGYKTTFAPDGTLLLVPSNLTDPSQIIVAGGFGKPDIKETRSKANQFLQMSTGSGNKVSPESFRTARNAYIADGGSGDDFNKEFSSYINFDMVDAYGVPLDLLR